MQSTVLATIDTFCPSVRLSVCLSVCPSVCTLGVHENIGLNILGSLRFITGHWSNGH